MRKKRECFVNKKHRARRINLVSLCRTIPPFPIPQEIIQSARSKIDGEATDTHESLHPLPYPYPLKLHCRTLSYNPDRNPVLIRDALAQHGMQIRQTIHTYMPQCESCSAPVNCTQIHRGNICTFSNSPYPPLSRAQRERFHLILCSPQHLTWPRI